MSKITKNFGHFIGNGLLILFSFINCFPILWMFYTALKTEKEYSISSVTLPGTLNLKNFFEAMDAGALLGGIANSFFLSTVSVAGILLISFVTGYLLSRFSFKGRNVIYTFFLGGMLIPVHALLVPVFMEFKQLGFLNHRYTLLLPYIVFGLATSIFLIENFVRKIPLEIEEAAMIDGCSFANRLGRIVFPMCRPVVATVVVMSFLDCWNEFSFGLILVSDESLKTLQVRLAAFAGLKVINYPRLMAALVIATIPVLLVYILLHNKIIDGMTAGAVKG